MWQKVIHTTDCVHEGSKRMASAFHISSGTPQQCRFFFSKLFNLDDLPFRMAPLFWNHEYHEYILCHSQLVYPPELLLLKEFFSSLPPEPLMWPIPETHEMFSLCFFSSIHWLFLIYHHIHQLFYPPLLAVPNPKQYLSMHTTCKFILFSQSL